MAEIYKLIRYNTGTDKKLFKEFAADYDAVLLNATIAAYSGSAMADLVSIYKDKYIIDPQTYILQQNVATLASPTSKKGGMKKSIEKYLENLPAVFKESLWQNGSIPLTTIENNLDDLVNSVGEFQLNYINSFMQKKEYNKYLDFIIETGEKSKMDPQPKLLIAPYFMIKDSYSIEDVSKWMELNRQALLQFISLYDNTDFPIAGQLVIEKNILTKLCDNNLSVILKAYSELDFCNLFIWVDDFSPIESDSKCSKAFSILLKELNRIGKNPIMAYGGFDSIILCHENSSTKLYGVAQSVGYGEKRQITPVGGGLPINKYYFPPTHQRLKFDDVTSILATKGYIDYSRSKKERAKEFYKNICDCPQCKQNIGDDIDGFLRYNDSIPFAMRNGIHRNRPTQEALDESARHFLYCKKREWGSLNNYEFKDLVDMYKKGMSLYGYCYDRDLYSRLLNWIENYAK